MNNPETMLDASVILCTHNPRKDYMSRVFDALRTQTISKERWEFIVVDNASRDPVEQIYDLSWHPLGRHAYEPELGVTIARRRGIRESQAPLLIFVDDDNVFASDYIERALAIGRDCPFLGAWGSGAISPEFEVEPAPHIMPLVPFLAIRQINQPVWCNSISCSDATPVGAGLCFRRNVGEAYLEFAKSSTIEIASLRGTSLEGHEDYEICYLACRDGKGMGIFPELKISHLIPKERVTDEYMRRMIRSRTYSHLLLLYKWRGSLPRSPYSLHGLASFVMNLFTRRGFDREIYFAELRAVIAARRRLLT
jgi:glycosyltransferase involved in cell wall biosynthesis